MTTVNSLTFRTRPPSVSDHFKNNRFVSQSNTIPNTTSILLYFKSVAILMHDITNNLAPQNILHLFKTTDQVRACNTGSQSRG